MSTNVLFVTERGLRHQQDALDAAPDGLNVTMLRQPDSATLNAVLADAEYLISERAGIIDAEVFKASPRLKLIQRLGAQTHDIDLDAARAAKIAVCYWPVESVIRVAEHTILQMLFVGKKLRQVARAAMAASPQWGESKRTNEDTFAYNWSGQTGVNQLWQRQVGIIGFGEIGIEVARRLAGWGCAVFYNKRRRLPVAVERELGLTYVDADTLLAQSDYLVNLLPYFNNTDLLLDADFLARMKDGAYLVSCGSGSVIDELALAEAIQTEKLAGAALDTFEWEPIRNDNPLIALVKSGYNVLLTPHTAAGTGNGRDVTELRGQDYENIVNHMVGRPLRYRLV